MNVNQLLDKLDTASMSLKAPDARRVVAQAANKLRAALQQHDRFRAAERALDAHLARRDISSQGTYIEADLRDACAREEIDLGEVIEDARQILDAWQRY